MRPADFVAAHPNHIRAVAYETSSGATAYDTGKQQIVNGAPIIVLRDNRIIRMGFVVVEGLLISIRDPNTIDELEVSCCRST
jgi:hypothetical protein